MVTQVFNHGRRQCFVKLTMTFSLTMIDCRIRPNLDFLMVIRHT